jgi:hypothetical protein
MFTFITEIPILSYISFLCFGLGLACLMGFRASPGTRNAPPKSAWYNQKLNYPYFIITTVIITVMFFLIHPLSLTLQDNYLRVRKDARLCACKSNLKNIGDALGIYRHDNLDCYPPSLSHLTPHYLKTLPLCPETGKVTYAYITSNSSDMYTTWCDGTYHVPFVTSDYPKYDAVQGLYER